MLILTPFFLWAIQWTFLQGHPISDGITSMATEKPTSSVDPRSCLLFISEVNIDNPGENQKQFLELETICTGKRKLKNPFFGYKLVVVKGNPLSIVMVVDLAKLLAPFADKRYILLGSSTIEPPVQINLSKEVQSIYLNQEEVNVLPVGDDSPYAIILVYNKSPLITREIQLYRKEDGSFLEFNLANDDLIQQYIRQNARDMIVYGRQVASSGCLFFDSIWPPESIDESNSMYVLRDWDSDTENSPDYTLNRCTSDLLGFKPGSFKYAPGTPGKINNCNTKGFFTEEIIDLVSPFRPLEISEDIDLGECSSPSKRKRTERYRDISPSAFQSVISSAATEEASCTTELDTRYSFAATTLEVNSLKSLIKRAGHSELIKDWNTKMFNSTWKDHCAEFLPKNGSILDDPEIQSWIEIDTSNNECRFSCSACKFYFENNFRKDIKHKQDIQTSKGFFSKCKSENQRKIKKHLKENVHFQAIRFKSQVSKASTTDQYNAVLMLAEKEQDQLLLPTIRLVKFVYAETLADIPFRKHKLLMQTLTNLGLDVGFHHQHAVAAEKVMSTISEGFHEALLKHLVEQQMVFSLMVDSTTDVSNTPLLICYLQTLEDGYPIVYFYALIYLDKGESAIATFNSFKVQLEKDNVIEPGFINFFKNNLISLSTDGASVNIGSERSFHTLTMAFIGRKVPLIHCMPHKLQLTINRAIRKQKASNFSDYFKSFEKSTTDFYVFYQSRGSKRWLHLVEVGQLIGIKPRRLKRFLEIRWASSEYEIMKSLVYDYDILKVDLLEMTSDKEFALNARTTALSLYTLLEDKTYSIVLREMLDLLAIYKEMSLKLQETAGILVDKSLIVEKGINEFRQLQTNLGAHVKSFLKNCSCPDVCGEGECNIVEFDECKEIYFNNFVLTDVGNSSIKMSKYRSVLYEAIIKEMYYYFDLELLQSFEIFNPKLIRLPECSSTIFANITSSDMCLLEVEELPTPTFNVEQTKLDKVCKFYEIEKSVCLEFASEWNVLMSKLSQMPVLRNNFGNEDASEFWPMALALIELPWTNLTRKFVNLVLVTAMTSSDCERGFSYVTRLKSNERSKLSTRVLENIVRIKVNGPKKIENFNAEKYARKFIENHVRVDDYSSKGGRPLKADSLKRKFKESRLF